MSLSSPSAPTSPSPAVTDDNEMMCDSTNSPQPHQQQSSSHHQGSTDIMYDCESEINNSSSLIAAK